VGGKDDKIAKENDASEGTDCSSECNEADELDNECEGKSARKASNHEVIQGRKGHRREAVRATACDPRSDCPSG
jgi:hypothetical protein